jgi:hypothetical protein
MNYQIEKATEVLSRTPLVLRSLLAGLSDVWTHQNEGDGSWSAFQVVGHLIINEETNFLPRAKLILSASEPPLLSPIDMTSHLTRFRDFEIDNLLSLFERLRLENLDSLKSLQVSEADLVKKAIHPKVGMIQLSHVLSTWVAHDLIHLGQITRVMAKQYKQAVGSFIEFLPRLN